MRARSPLGFTRFKVTRVFWKAVAVPAITYANAVVVMSGALVKKITTAQVPPSDGLLPLPVAGLLTSSYRASWPDRHSK